MYVDAISQMHLLSEEEVAKVKRMQQKNAQRKQHEKELKRFHESQEIQQQLEDVEMRQREIERFGVEIEKTLTGEENGVLLFMSKCMIIESMIYLSICS